MPSENFAKIFSDRALNRPRSPEGRSPSGTFGSFRTSEKNKSVLPCREIRGFPNLESAPPNNDHALTKLKPFSALVSPHMVALLTSVRNSPCFGGLRRTKTCHWQLFARPSRKFIPAGTAHCVCFFRRPRRQFPAFPAGNFFQLFDDSKSRMRRQKRNRFFVGFFLCNLQINSCNLS